MSKSYDIQVNNDYVLSYPRRRKRKGKLGDS